MARRLFRGSEAGVDADGAPTGRAAWEVQRGPLVICGLLLLLAVGFAVRVPVNLPVFLTDQWPAILIVGGGALLLLGLVTARAAGVLLGPVLVALGLTAALAGQEALTLRPELVGGILLLALAAALLLRGVSFARQ